MKKVKSSANMSKGVLKKSARTSSPDLSKKRFTKKKEVVLSTPLKTTDGEDDFIIKFD